VSWILDELQRISIVPGLPLNQSISKQIGQLARGVKLSRSEHLRDLVVLLPSFRGRDSRLTLQETPYILKRRIRMPFGIVCPRIFAGRRRSQTNATKIMIRSEKTLPGSFVKLEIYIQRDRDVISILQPVRSVYRTMNANSGPQVMNNRTRLELRPTGAISRPLASLLDS
jgi:hypothetical protein